MLHRSLTGFTGLSQVSYRSLTDHSHSQITHTHRSLTLTDHSQVVHRSFTGLSQVCHRYLIDIKYLLAAYKILK